MKVSRDILGVLLGLLGLVVCAQLLLAASLDGTWNFVFTGQDGQYPKTIVLSTHGDQVTAKITGAVLNGTYKNGQLQISGDYYAEEAGYKARLKLSGKLVGDQIKGNATWDDYQLTFIATRAR